MLNNTDHRGNPYHPDRETVVAICLALRIPREKRWELFNLANAKEYLRSHEYASSNYDAENTDTKRYGRGRTVRTMSEKDLINAALMRRAEIAEALDVEGLEEEEKAALEASFTEIENYLADKLTQLNADVDSSGVSYIKNPTTDDERAVNEWLSFIDDFNDKMMIATGATGAKENAVQRLIYGEYSEVTKDLQELGDQGAVTAEHLADPKYDDFIDKCIELGIISDDSVESLDFLALAFNTVGTAAGGAAYSAANAEAKLKGVMATMAAGSSKLTQELSGALGDLATDDGKVYASTIREIGEAIKGYEEGYTDWTEDEVAYNKLAEAAQKYGISVDELLTILIDLGLVQDDIAATTDKITASFSTLKEELTTVNSAISEQATSGSITLETYNALIAASSDYASCIEYENGYMQLNAEKARELIDAKTQLQILELEQAKIDEAENYKRIAQALEDAADSDAVYRAALEAELDVSEQLITKYRVMQSELAETLSAYNKWKTAQNDPESGDMYDDTITALEQIQEGLETGKVGTAKYEAAVEFLIPEANRGDVSAYIESLKRYISEDVTGVSNFISDAITAGLMVDDGSGNITIVSDATIQDFCEKLQITPSMAQAIFGELEEYGWEFDWTTEDFIGTVDPVQVPTEVDLTALEALQTQLADYRAQLAALEGDPLTLQADVTALEEKIAITEQAIVDAGGVVPVDTTAAESSLLAVQEDLDIRIIKESYEKHIRNHSFVEDVRGYNI